MRRMFSEKQIREFADAQAKAVKKDISTLVDKDGHDRFIEGNGTPSVLEGFTSTFCKWSLSGSHLMLVLAGTFADESIIVADTTLASFTLPQWIFDKIYPVFSNWIETKSITLRGDDWSSQSFDIVYGKSSNKITIVPIASVTLTAERSFRIAIDLLVDNE